RDWSSDVCSSDLLSRQFKIHYWTISSILQKRWVTKMCILIWNFCRLKTKRHTTIFYERRRRGYPKPGSLCQLHLRLKRAPSKKELGMKHMTMQHTERLLILSS